MTNLTIHSRDKSILNDCEPRMLCVGLPDGMRAPTTFCLSLCCLSNIYTTLKAFRSAATRNFFYPLKCASRFYLKNKNYTRLRNISDRITVQRFSCAIFVLHKKSVNWCETNKFFSSEISLKINWKCQGHCCKNQKLQTVILSDEELQSTGKSEKGTSV